MGSNSLNQVNELLRLELATALAKELELPHNVVLSITKVRTAPDLHNATVYISVVPDDQAGSVLNLVRKKLSHIMRSISGRLVLKNVPKIQIQLDETERAAARVEAILDKLKETS